jgi:hypothetical protein
VIRDLRLPESQISEFDFRISGFQGFRISRFQDFRVSGDFIIACYKNFLVFSALLPRSHKDVR